MIKISPSILAADFSRLRQQVELVEQAGADMLHIDVMDGHFVPNISMGIPILQSIRNFTELELDLHLMIDDPDKLVSQFVQAGADMVTVHYEAARHIHRTIQFIKDHGARAGVAVNPATPANSVKYLLNDVDMVLVMTVNPGFSGQRFIPEMIDKIREVRDMVGDRPVDIQIDGGINLHNIYDLTRMGANVVVAGAAIYNADDPSEMIKKFREMSCR